MCADLLVNKDRKGKGDLKEGQKVDKTNAVGTTHCSSQEVLLQTLLVKPKIRDCKGTVRSIIDMGCQRSYILKITAIEIKCQHVCSEALVQVLFGGVASKLDVHHCYQTLLHILTGS